MVDGRMMRGGGYKVDFIAQKCAAIYKRKRRSLIETPLSLYNARPQMGGITLIYISLL